MRGTSEGKRFRRMKASAGLAAAAVVALTLLAAPRPAQAGIMDQVKGLFELPGDVERLKEGYEQIQGQYDESLRQLDEARQQAEAYKSVQDQLMADNAKLLEQNRKLADMVEELHRSEEARAGKSRRLQQIIWTAVLLAAGYLAVTRLTRFIMRTRSG